MKIPFLSNVYSAFSHIRSRSLYSLPPLFTIFPDITLAPTSTAPCGQDVSEDVLGQPWEEIMSEQISTFCQITF
ncbi:Disintegrin and metalloproteinase domain containing protein 17 like [Dissostichus eleginoides]|uniref:Disintegrin and metalloproteinase domain containing protein 17 like n=1 Tax=Dissostichus eleginoides TaxID=100907 RepID=A0AAD9FJT2_DISEL|nr:Disintegrin and metalloproteinase domain containing protein 17 like [Dissostichus eleginoides]